MDHCHRMSELFGEADTFAVGIGSDERHRFDDGAGGGVGPRKADDGWLYHPPMHRRGTKRLLDALQRGARRSPRDNGEG
jgi:hypothetical protein